MNRKCPECGKPTIWLYCSEDCKQSAHSKRYSRKTLRYSNTSVTGMKRYSSCKHCKRLHERRGKYCSDKCKQAAYRKRKDPDSGSWANRRRRAQKAVQTKRNTDIEVVCKHCGESRRFNVLSGALRDYCSDKCKQAAYRKRKKQETKS